MADNRNGYTVTCEVVSFIVIIGKPIGLRQSHEAGGFARRDKTRTDFGAFNNDDCLAARASRGCSEASSDVVETRFRALNLATNIIVPGAFVDTADDTLASLFRGGNFSQINLTHHGDQLGGLRGRMPRDALRVVFN